MKKIYLIRHGKTIGNEKGWIYGASDVPLTGEGREKIAANREAGIYPAHNRKEIKFFTTGMSRTEETFEIIFGNRDHGILEGLKELNFGIYEEKTFTDMTGDADYEKWVHDKTGTVRPEGGESIRDFTLRVENAFDEFLREHGNDERDCVIVCHGGTIGVIMCRYFAGDGEAKAIYRWVPDPGRGYALTAEGDRIREYEEI